MEKRFHANFADVRIHPERNSVEKAAGLKARASTRGEHIYFAQNQFQPRTRKGFALLAHELTHVLQQRNGQFFNNSSAESRQRLEEEAERAEQSFLRSGSVSVSVGGAAPIKHQQAVLIEEITARVFGNVDALADYIIESVGEEASALMRRVSSLRSRLGLLREVQIPSSGIAELQGLYGELRGSLPNWVPVPNIDLTGGSGQQAAQAIPVAALLLLLALAIVVLWLLGNLDPDIRRQRESDVERLVEPIERVLRAPRVMPELEPKPVPEPKPRTLGPDIIPDVDFPDDEPDEHGCQIIFIGQQFGRYPCHAAYATSLSGGSREFRVIAPDGDFMDFDAMDYGGTLYEVKTGYRWVPFTTNEEARRRVESRFVIQSENQLDVAEKCHRPLDWYFNEDVAAAYFESRLRVSVLHVPFDCDLDSDD